MHGRACACACLWKCVCARVYVCVRACMRTFARVGRCALAMINFSDQSSKQIYLL